MIGRKVSEMILDGEELEFYKWGGDGWTASLASVKRRRNSAPPPRAWSHGEKDRCLEETGKSFQLSGSSSAHPREPHLVCFARRAGDDDARSSDAQTFLYIQSSTEDKKTTLHGELPEPRFDARVNAPPRSSFERRRSPRDALRHEVVVQVPPPRSKLCLRSSVLAASARDDDPRQARPFPLLHSPRRGSNSCARHRVHAQRQQRHQ